MKKIINRLRDSKLFCKLIDSVEYYIKENWVWLLFVNTVCIVLIFLLALHSLSLAKEKTNKLFYQYSNIEKYNIEHSIKLDSTKAIIKDSVVENIIHKIEKLHTNVKKTKHKKRR